ncbi:MAG: amino acid ABC transporter substrate-binding protein [Alphaproteobacteria bacterium]|nr:amino acid ABC transporter substrate-binding protein [Alphaproteobacteria bacterium]
MITRRTFLAAAATTAAAGPAVIGARVARAATPMVIGLPLSQTGNLADSAEHVRKAIALWQEQLNAKGGLLDRPVELKIYDDKSDPATAARLTERLITNDKVDLLLSPYGSAGTSTASAVSEKHRVVMINVAGASQMIHQRGFKYVFQVVAPISAYVAGVFPIAKSQGYKSLVFISRDYSAARDMEQEIKLRAAEIGAKIVMAEYFPSGTADFSSYIARGRDLKPDVWISVGYPNEAIEMIRQMKASNYLPPMFIHNGVSQEDFLTATGKDAEYAFGMSLYEPMLKTKDNVAFVRDFVAKWGYEPGYYAACGWGAVKVLEEAVRKIGGTDQEKLRAALSSLETETPFGPYKVDATGGQIAKKGLIVQILKGKREVVWPDDVQSAKPVLPLPPWSQR